eukprot:scaffold31390_cov88-Skeletonema_marinoi.AAC.1
MTTETQTLSNQHASRASNREGQERSSVPAEVSSSVKTQAQDIVEVWCWCCTFLAAICGEHARPKHLVHCKNPTVANATN